MQGTYHNLKIKNIDEERKMKKERKKERKNERKKEKV